MAFSVSDVTKGVNNASKVGFLVVLDRDGNVVGYKQWPLQQVYARYNPAGGWYSLQGKTTLSALNLEGMLMGQWSAADAGVDSFHHEILPIGPGTFATLSSTLDSISGYPEGTLDVIADVVLEVNLKDQTLEVLWDLFSTLDPFRTERVLLELLDVYLQ